MPAHGRRTNVHLRRLATLAVSSVLVAVVLATPPAAAATVLEVDAGYGGSYRSGAPVPVRVRIAADRLVRGELEVQASAGFGDVVTVSAPVEAPGGTVKEVVVVAPTNGQSGRADVVAVLRQGGTEVARGSASVQASADTELVGLLPGALAGRPPPAAAPLAIDAGTARFSALGPAELAAAPASLAALDVVGAAPDDLADLDDAARTAVLAWVGGGGFLLVDSPPGAPVDGLPAAWQPDERGRATAGLGEVRATDGAMAAGTWAGLIEPTPVANGQATQFFGGFGLDATLASDAGLRIPELGWLVGFLAVYVVVAVPLTLTLLRRRGRGELGWVVLPLVALVFTAVSYGAGREARAGATAAHASVVHVTEASALATTSVGIVSADGGRVEASYPRRWTAAVVAYPSGPPTQVQAALAADGTDISQQLDVGQFGVHRATGPVAVEGSLEVTATASDDDTLEGTVRNTMPFALEEVAVFHDQWGATLGRLEAGEERAWTLGLVGQDPGHAFPGPAAEAWPEAAGFDRPPDPDSVVAFPLWSEFAASTAADVLAPGTVAAAGWTRDYTPPIDIPGSSLSGRTMVVSTGSVVQGADGVLGPTVESETMRGPLMDGGMVDESAPLVVRLTLPSPAGGSPVVDPSGLVVRAPAVLALDAWTPEGWQAITGGDAGAGPDQPQVAGDAFVGQPGLGPMAEHALPPEAVDAGVVWVRARTVGFGFVDPYTLAMTTVVSLGSAS